MGNDQDPAAPEPLSVDVRGSCLQSPEHRKNVSAIHAAETKVSIHCEIVAVYFWCVRSGFQRRELATLEYLADGGVKLADAVKSSSR